MWVARNKNGELSLFNVKPVRCKEWLNDDCEELIPIWALPKRDNPIRFGSWNYVHMVEIQHMFIDSSLFPNLKWEDEPIEVNLYQTNPVYTKECYNCGGEFKYHRSDIQTSYSYQPSSGAEDGWSYLVCPHNR